MSVATVLEFWQWIRRDEEALERYTAMQQAGADGEKMIVLFASSRGFEFTIEEYQQAIEQTDDHPTLLNADQLEAVSAGALYSIGSLRPWREKPRQDPPRRPPSKGRDVD